MENLYLPEDTYNTGIKHEEIDNFALRLNKFPQTHIDNKKKLKFTVYHKYREDKRDKIIKVNKDFQNSQRTNPCIH